MRLIAKLNTVTISGFAAQSLHYSIEGLRLMASTPLTQLQLVVRRDPFLPISSDVASYVHT